MSKQTLLVIDDSQDIHPLVGVWLIDESIEIHSAFDGASGLEQARALSPDLILLDVDMPATDGFEVCAQLKADAKTRDIPVVFLTGASDTGEKLRGLELGAIDYIIKPFDPAELRARVRASLRTKHLLDLLAQKAIILQESEERFRVLAENASDVISRHNAAGEYQYVSPAAQTVLGYDPRELMGRPLSEFIHADQRALVEVWQATGGASDGPCPPVALRFLHKSGHYVWLEFTFRVLAGENGGVREIHGSARDISQRMRLQQMEEDRAEVLEMVVQNRPMADVMNHLVKAAEQLCPEAAAGCILLFDGELHHVSGKLPAELQAALEERLYSFTSRFCTSAATRGEVFTSDMERDPIWEPVRPVALASGLQTCWASLIKSGHDDVLGVFCLYHCSRVELDNTVGSFLKMAGKLIMIAVEHHQLTDQLAHRAQHDALTGLPNRVLFEDRLQQALLRGNISGKTVGVAFLDVDRFKNINDTLGHHAGDVMLCRLVARVLETLGKADTLARMGGDEFALILPDLNDPAAAEAYGDRLINAFKAPLDVLGQELFVTISVGLAMYPKDGRDSITLKKNADAALYVAKNNGRDRMRCFTADMNNGTRERLDLENSLRRAVENGELRLHYQPKVDANDRIVGVEALLRWQHPTLGFIQPAKFIPLAEETGLIVPIGKWVLNESVRQLQAWRRAGLRCVPVAVNVSAVQFAQPDFENVLAEVLQAHALEPRWLELEITESVLMQNMHDARQRLEQLKNIGVSIAIDDFGTGYSSLVYLQRLPIDVLKVDRAFVSVIGAGQPSTKGRDDATIVRSIAALAHSLGISLVAEGVETEYQRALLLDIGCPVMQGYLYSKARSPEEVAELLQTGIIPRIASAPLKRLAS
jgi:diguanylate cyclase (GGDEF)-like protein/PAS domain S-box-containing protein